MPMLSLSSQTTIRSMKAKLSRRVLACRETYQVQSGLTLKIDKSLYVQIAARDVSVDYGVV